LGSASRYGGNTLGENRLQIDYVFYAGSSSQFNCEVTLKVDLAAYNELLMELIVETYNVRNVE
jgi:hypothetical protein